MPSPQTKSLLDHVLTVAGYPLAQVGKLMRWEDMTFRSGSPITFIRWDGCMGHIRTVTGTGVIVRKGNNRDRWPDGDDIAGLWARKADGTDVFVPWSYVRIADGAVESWE